MSAYQTIADDESAGNPPVREQRVVQRNYIIIITVGLWLVIGVAATLWMAHDASSPGAAGSPPAKWPVASQVPRSPQLPTLVMFVHPRCPCSRASLGELAELMAHCQGKVAGHVLFFKPTGEKAEWAQTDMWRTAAAIPGIAVHLDEEGREAKLFGSETSGETLLFNPDGQLIFQGGITLARGHSGDNPGRDSIIALLNEQPSVSAATPVFGCSLGQFQPLDIQTPQACKK